MDNNPQQLSQLFDSSHQIVQSLDENNILESNSKEFQDLVSKGIHQLEQVTQMINQLSLFSTNESIDEVSSMDMKYLLTPAFLGFLSEKCQQQTRVQCLESAEIYYKDFLKRLSDYGIINQRQSDEDEEESDTHKREPDLSDIVRNRNSKIERYQRKKQMDIQLLSLKNHDGDSEVMRKYHVLLLKKWSEVAIEELNSLRMETKLLKQSGKNVPKKDSKVSKVPFKPFIITRNELQKKVYGMGYPSVPTMTVDEFVDQKQKDGSWAFDNKNIYSNSLQEWAEDPDRKHHEDEEIAGAKESLEEREDSQSEAAIQKARDMDEFKDEVKRGSGNRANMS